jgi:hypothetical protein
VNATTDSSGGAGIDAPPGPSLRERPARRGAAAGWTAGLAVFAAMMLLTSGMFQVLEGLAALIKGAFFVVTSDYAYRVDVTAWGWGHLVLGLVGVAVGVGVLRGSVTARYLAMGFAVVSAVVHFVFIPYQPVWSVLVIALDVAVIWALAAFDPRSV